MAGKRWIERLALVGVGVVLGWIFIPSSGNPAPADPAESVGSRGERFVGASEGGSATDPTATATGEPVLDSVGVASPSPSPDPATSPTVPLATLARPTLRTADGARRTLRFNQLIESMTAADAPAIAQIFEDLRGEGLEFHPEGDFFAQRWGEIAPDAARAYVEEHGDFGRHGKSMESVFTGWAMTHPAGALEWILNNPDDQHQPAALKGLAQGWARTDPSGAADMVFNVLQGQEQEEAAEMVTWQVLYGQGMEGATAWFDRLPKDPESAAARHRAFRVLKERQLMRETEEANTWVAEREPAPNEG